jgi:hypothetical protein
MTELKTETLLVMAFCVGCLSQHLRRQPVRTQACNVRDCECWCMTQEDLVTMPVSALPAVGKLVCDQIATGLVQVGYSGITGQQVADQLARPSLERSIVGRLAAGILNANGLTEWTVSYS